MSNNSSIVFIFIGSFFVSFSSEFNILFDRRTLSNEENIFILLFTWDIISSKFSVLNFISASAFSGFELSKSSIDLNTFSIIEFIIEEINSVTSLFLLFSILIFKFMLF